MKLIDVILRPLRNTAQPIRHYVWKAGLFSLLPSLAIGALLSQFMTTEPSSMLLKESPLSILFLLLVYAPLVETLFLWLFLWILHFWIKRPVPLALASALIWGALHMYPQPARGVAPCWSFFVFTICFIEWRKRSRFKAFTATALIHAFQNTLPALAILALRLRSWFS